MKAAWQMIVTSKLTLCSRLVSTRFFLCSASVPTCVHAPCFLSFWPLVPLVSLVRCLSMCSQAIPFPSSFYLPSPLCFAFCCSCAMPAIVLSSIVYCFFQLSCAFLHIQSGIALSLLSLPAFVHVHRLLFQLFTNMTHSSFASCSTPALPCCAAPLRSAAVLCMRCCWSFRNQACALR